MGKPVICGIYRILNTYTGQIYFGSSINVYNRLRQHQYHLRRGNHKNGRLQRSWAAFSEHHFRFELFEECAESLMAARESELIETHQTCNETKGFNIFAVAYDIGENTRRGLGANRLGRKLTPEHAAAISRGKKAAAFKHSQETKDRISAKKTGVKRGPYSEDRKRKAAEGLKRWHREVGHSAATLAKMSATRIRNHKERLAAA